MVRLRLVLCLLLFVVIVVPADAAKRPRFKKKTYDGPAVSFEETAVVATGVKPGATVYFASLSLFAENSALHIEKPAGSASDLDRDGVVRFEVPKQVRRRSVWIVVDGDAGTHTVSAPPGFLLNEIEMPNGAVHAAPNGALKRIVMSRQQLDYFFIRPGTGIWTGNAKDGTSRDEDKKFDGKVTFDLTAAKPVADAPPPPEHFRGGDILFVVDRDDFNHFVMKQGR